MRERVDPNRKFSSPLCSIRTRGCSLESLLEAFQCSSGSSSGSSSSSMEARRGGEDRLMMILQVTVSGGLWRRLNEAQSADYYYGLRWAWPLCHLTLQKPPGLSS